MDALSNVLNSVRLEGAVFLNAQFTAPWCVLSKFGLAGLRSELAGGDHVVYFHYLTSGSCKVYLSGDPAEPVQIQAGDLLLFPHGERHVMGSDLQLAPVESAGLLEPGEDEPDYFRIRHGGGGAVTHFVCGYLSCSRAVFRPLLDALPRMVRIPIGNTPAAVLVRELLRAGVSETSAARPGASSMRAKLSELLFVEAMRAYVEELPPEVLGWLAGVRDPHVGRALALMHSQPARAWTVDELAREVALSRSALAERFTTLVGESPIQYLLRWRLALAAHALRSSSEPIIRVAERSGYESEAAFSRAFKREFGAPPATWRRSAATMVPVPPD